MKEKSLKNKSGITLIALIIAIIVLLILAGVTIISLQEENGIINQAIKARNNTNDAEIKEEVMRAWYTVQNGSIDKNVNNSKIAYYLKDILSAEDKNVSVVYNENKDIFEVYYKEKNLEINTLGKITLK